MINKKNFAVIGLIVLVLAVAGVFTYREMAKKSIERSVLETPTNVSGVTMTGNGTVNVVPLGNQKLPKAPTLERPTDFKNTLTPEAKTIVLAHIEANVKALKKDPHDIEEWTGLGINRKMLGDYEGARDAWEYAKVLNPTNVIPWNNLGDLYHYYLKDYSKSEENWKKTIVLKSDYVAGYRGLVDLYQYSLIEKKGEIPTVLKPGIAKNPDLTDLQVMLAQYYREAGQIAEAKEAYNKAIATAERLKNTNLADLLKGELTGLK